MEVPITVEDYHRWIGELYVEMQQWRKAAAMAERQAAEATPREEAAS